MYIALYRKWRPKIFSDVVAQSHITTVLKNEIKLNKTAHSYLFTGPRGTGKTTCARIFAKAINCSNPCDGEPCCQCEYCKNIENGTFLDVVELDGASNNGVNDIKNLKNETSFVPAHCKFKIYIIDEVHMLSTSAFNALLKIMEEPPPYVIFILATTEVEKVIPTIVSRCQRFDFKRVSESEIKNRLIKIAEFENFKIKPNASERIAQMANGSMRDAVSILDECSVVSNEINIETINELFGLTGATHILNLFNALQKSDYKEVIKTVNLAYNNGKEIQSFCSEFISLCREILDCKIKNKVVDEQYTKVESNTQKQIIEISKNLSLNCILKILNESLDCFDGLKQSLDKKLKFELFILGLCFKFEKLNNLNLLNESGHLEKYKTENHSETIDETKTVSKNKKIDKKQNLSNNLCELIPLQNWSEILNELKPKLNNEMISSFLIESEAFVDGDKLFINFKNSIVSKKVLEKKNEISSIIKQRTGKNYRIFIKKTDKIDQVEPSDSKNVKNLLNIAKKLEIEVDEK